MKKSTPFSKMSILIMALTFGLILNSAYAQKPDKKQEKIEAGKAETMARLDIVFKDADQDHDGKLNKNEVKLFKAHALDFLTKMLTMISEDSNGKRTVHEPPVEQLRVFVDNFVKASDKDNDGQLSRNELTALRNEMEKSLKLN